MSATFAIITCHRSLSQICQVRQFSILRRSTLLFGRLTRVPEFKVDFSAKYFDLIHSERLRVRLPRKERLQQKLEDESAENIPSGLFQKLKYYLKRGLDVVGLLEFLRLPENWIQKVREMPKAASTLTATFVLIKIFTPIRYATTIVGTNLTYKALKHFGLLRTAKQLEFRGRLELESLMKKLNERRISAAAKYRKKSGNGTNKSPNGGHKKEHS
uniref:DUF1279 domain-containing protein n=1 Tax=Meloidogyne hapla TaxID=6305 RepID=A0A1I8BDM5_MELHA